MTERAIQIGLFNEYQGNSMLIPNWTAPNWWEADVARIMPSGRWTEIEIKLTKGDFQADARKLDTREARWVAGRPGPGSHSRVKHLELPAGESKGPNQFYFAMPEALAAKVDIPVWAGLLVARQWGKRVLIHLDKKAPELHREKFTFALPEKNVFYWRMWKALERLEEAKTKLANKTT
jgi:hypothetical protein